MTPPAPDVSALTNYQAEIYLRGLVGARPALPTDLTRHGCTSWPANNWTRARSIRRRGSGHRSGGVLSIVGAP